MRAGTEKRAEKRCRRAERGDPPRIIVGSERNVVGAHFPNEPLPPNNVNNSYTPREVVAAFDATRKQHKSLDSSKPLRLKKMKNEYAVNIIQFSKPGGKKKMTSLPSVPI